MESCLNHSLERVPDRGEDMIDPIGIEETNGDVCQTVNEIHYLRIDPLVIF
jgi:hypothetical protein